MIEPDSIEARALKEAEGVLTYFHNLESLGAFAGEPVTDQKRSFLMMVLVNFARRERIFHPEVKTADG